MNTIRVARMTKIEAIDMYDYTKTEYDTRKMGDLKRMLQGLSILHCESLQTLSNYPFTPTQKEV